MIHPAKITQLKERITNAQQILYKLKAERNLAKKQLNDIDKELHQLGINSRDELSKHIKIMTNDINKLTELIEEKIGKLENVLSSLR